MSISILNDTQLPTEFYDVFMKREETLPIGSQLQDDNNTPSSFTYLSIGNNSINNVTTKGIMFSKVGSFTFKLRPIFPF